MDTGLKGRVAVVTGASRGIGRAIAWALAGEGARVACVATTREGVKPVSDHCATLGGEAEAFGVDVSSHSAVAELAQEIQKRFGGVDILVNNAGVTRDGLVMRMSEEDWDRVLDVNLKGAFNMVRAFARSLLKSKAGRIINIASVVGIAGNAGQANYAASKGGLIALTRSLAKEFGGRGVCVNALAPGFIETDMTQGLNQEQKNAMLQGISLSRAGTPEDVARGAIFLASDWASYVTGQVIPIDGGLRI